MDNNIFLPALGKMRKTTITSLSISPSAIKQAASETTANSKVKFEVRKSKMPLVLQQPQQQHQPSQPEEPRQAINQDQKVVIDLNNEPGLDLNNEPELDETFESGETFESNNTADTEPSEMFEPTSDTEMFEAETNNNDDTSELRKTLVELFLQMPENMQKELLRIAKDSLNKQITNYVNNNS
jgi:hypothetical protein